VQVAQAAQVMANFQAFLMAAAGVWMVIFVS
jgi:hypothetical protein